MSVGSARALVSCQNYFFVRFYSLQTAGGAITQFNHPRMWVDTRDSHATLMPTRHRRRSTTFLASPSRHRSRLDAAQVAGGLCYMQFQPRRVPFALFHRAAHRSFHQLRRGEWLRQRKAACGFLGGVVAAPLLGCLSERGMFCRRDVFRSCGHDLHAWAALRELRRDESLCRA